MDCVSHILRRYIYFLDAEFERIYSQQLALELRPSTSVSNLLPAVI